MSAENPYVNKVQTADGTVIMDISSDTATPSDVLNGVTFHDRSGTPQTGSLITHNVYDGLDSSSTSDALSANQGKELNSKITNILKNIGGPSGGSSKNYTIENNSRIAIFTIGGGQSQGMWLINCQSTGPINIFEVKKASGVALTSDANNKITITNSGSVTAFAFALEFAGSIT